jgi:hypothetical protein
MFNAEDAKENKIEVKEERQKAKENLATDLH